jgi:hypothetical protein
MASMDTQESESAVRKCIDQLNSGAPSRTVLRAKRAVLERVCRDYCHMSPDELQNLGTKPTKDQLYSAAAAWVCA